MSSSVHVLHRDTLKRTSKAPSAKLHADLLSARWLQTHTKEIMRTGQIVFLEQRLQQTVPSCRYQQLWRLKL